MSAALDAAGHEVCLAMFPSHRAFVEEILARGTARASGNADLNDAARAVSRSVMESRAGDGATTTVHYVPRDEPGQWRRTPSAMRPPELPHWGKVAPFVLQSAAQFRPPPPPDIHSDAFAREMQDVREIGGKESARRMPEETETAKFWSDFSYTTSPPGHWNEIARSLAGPRLNQEESARLFSLLNLAMVDAGIAVWECKFQYNFWRPVTALNRPGSPAWQPLLQSPPHPDYVSGHSAFSGAAATVLAAFFGSPDLDIAVTSDSIRGVTRSYRNVHECAAEVSRSRVLGGIHFPAACREGIVLGGRIGDWCMEHAEKMPA